MPRFCLFFALFLFTLLSCKKEEEVGFPTTTPIAVQEGLYGTWEIEWRSVNGQVSLEALCCEFIEFGLDSPSQEEIGSWSYMGNGGENGGTYVLDIENDQMLTIDDDGDSLLISYMVIDSLLELSFNDGADDLIEGWRKQ